MESWQIARIVLFVVLVVALFGARRYLRSFFWRMTFCLVPLFVSGVIVGDAVHRYETDGGGFKLGVDLVGGTILVYEVDPDKMNEKSRDEFKPDQLAARLKHRIDPTDLYNVTIRPVNSADVRNTRVEIILPTGGAHQAKIQEQNAKDEWQRLLEEARAKWEQLKDAPLDALAVGEKDALIEAIHKQTGASLEEAEQFVRSKSKAAQKKDLTSEQVQYIKSLIAQVGSLEFRILANDKDDVAGTKAAKDYLQDAANKEEEQRRALRGMPPATPATNFPVTLASGETLPFTYSWVELGRQERYQLGLNNAVQDPWTDAIDRARNNWTQLVDVPLESIKKGNQQELIDKISEKTNVPPQEVERFVGGVETRRAQRWKEIADARDKGEALAFPEQHGLLFSRKCLDTKLTDKQREEKKFEYFLLTRDPEKPQDAEGKEISKAVTGEYLTGAAPGHDERNNWAVTFHFNNTGANLFFDLTNKNRPTGEEGSQYRRHLAIVLDGLIVSAPSLHQAIRADGQITGSFTEKEVTSLVGLLRAGALPATLKPQPVSESTMGATLGEDTIQKGTFAVGAAFAAILIFMVVYYRFAGLVACIALMANLLMTVAFMVMVSATFTLPGLAGLVLMIGMAVDANVLIYERLREERERGATLALAIRNGYDRAFPTIIDTHLSSIFTAIVLYTVGNDQLKGFGISLTVGLIISLFTSLYMTRTMFDLWLSKNWLHKLSMFRLFARPNINFMGIRYYWFTATILLTIFGIAVFIARLPYDLNIDFNGGTAYGGRLAQPLELKPLRDLLEEKSQEDKLKVDRVEEVSSEGRTSYIVTYANDVPGTERQRTITLANQPPEATKEERELDVKDRASRLPDVSVEQIFPQDEKGPGSHYFTVRTMEKERDLVQASIVRLLGDKLEKTTLATVPDANNKGAKLSFSDPDGKPTFASPAQVSDLLKRECTKEGVSQGFTLANAGKQDSEGRFDQMHVSWSEGGITADKLTKVLEGMQREFKDRPLPDRLETFDKQLAEETQTRAMYAILGSWGAILLYLWFRFGNWTFGLAAVLCLIHDLFFTMGIIAFCHYIHPTWFGQLLMIQDFKIDLPAVAALLTLVGYSTNDTIVVFDRIREVRGKNPELTPQTINDSVNQTLSRTVLASFATWLVVFVLYVWGGEGVHLFAFVMVVGVVVGTYSSIYIASPLLLIFGEGKKPTTVRERQPQPVGVEV